MRINKYRLQLVKESGFNYESNTVSCQSDMSDMFEKTFQMSEQAEEIFCILCFDTKNKVVGAFEVSRGSLNASIIHPREIFKRVLLTNASSISLGHNHPSGNPKPSKEDVEITKRIIECGNLLGIKVLDHIIIGDESYSLRAECDCNF